MTGRNEERDAASRDHRLANAAGHAAVEGDFRSYHRCGAAGVPALGVSATGTERVSRALTRAWIRNPGKFPPN